MAEEDRRIQAAGARGVTASPWPAVWAIFAGGLVAGAYVGKVPPALPEIRAELGLGLVESGFVATTFNVLGGIVGMLVGVLCDRFGHKRLALAGLALMAAGGLAGAAAGAFLPVLAARFLEGAGFILYTVSAPALLAAAPAAPTARAKALGFWGAYLPSGCSLALLAAPPVIAVSGWRGLWIVLAAAAAACAVLVARRVPAPAYGSVGSLRLARESLARPGSVVLSVLFACYVAQWISVMIWLPTFLEGERGATPSEAAFLTAMMVLANLPGNLAGGWLLARGVQRGLLVVAASAIGAACSLGMLGAWLPDALRYLLVLVFSCCTGVIPAAIFSGVALHARTPQHIGTTNGMVMQAAQIGQFFGPIAIAWLATRLGGWAASLWALLAFAAAAAACGLAIGAIERRRR